MIQQRCQTPSLYLKFLAANPNGGLQHWSSWPENYDERYDRAVANGYNPAQEGAVRRGRFVYFRDEGHPGTIIEMSHATPKRKAIFDALRVAAVGWDGRDPIRAGWPNIDWQKWARAVAPKVKVPLLTGSPGLSGPCDGWRMVTGV
jgi:hypothetical protein